MSDTPLPPPPPPSLKTAGTSSSVAYCAEVFVRDGSRIELRRKSNQYRLCPNVVVRLLSQGSQLHHSSFQLLRQPISYLSISDLVSSLMVSLGSFFCSYLSFPFSRPSRSRRWNKGSTDRSFSPPSLTNLGIVQDPEIPAGPCLVQVEGKGWRI